VGPIRRLALGLCMVAAQSGGVRAMADSSCVPAARVDGGSAIEATVIAELRRRGITTSPAGACPFVRADLRERGDNVVVHIVDADGRVVERTANGPLAAATLIESWTRADVVAPLLVARPDPVPTFPTTRTLASQVDTRSQVIATPRPPRDRLPPALSLTASGETSLATDGSIWFGLSAGLCVPMGPVCTGALARVASDPGRWGDSQDRHSSRLAADVLLGAALPFRRGRLTLLPALALGVGWMRTSALKSTVSGDTLDVDSGGIRTSSSIQISFALSPRLALDLGLTVDFAPLAHTAPYDAEATFLAGEPLAYFRAGVGLRIGLP
jgi:hypothetical protein